MKKLACLFALCLAFAVAERRFADPPAISR